MKKDLRLQIKIVNFCLVRRGKCIYIYFYVYFDNIVEFKGKSKNLSFQFEGISYV